MLRQAAYSARFGMLQTAEDARYLEVLDGINEWEIAANEVILNTQNLIIGAGVDRGEAETASLTSRDDTTQAIAEGQNQAQAGITGQEIEIKQSVQDALDQFFIDYANAALTIDAETRAAIRAAQEQAADSFWGSVIEIGGTVLGVAAGAAVSGLTGGAIPPNIAIGFGAQLGGAGGGLLADAVVGDNDNNALFHFPETDWIARDIAKSEELRQSRERPYFADQNQIRNARDVAREISAGVQEAMNTNNRGGFGGQQESPVNVNLTLMVDSDQLVTPRFAEAVSDQLSVNEQSGYERR